jgi:hypothetical protein
MKEKETKERSIHKHICQLKASLSKHVDRSLRSLRFTPEPTNSKVRTEKPKEKNRLLNPKPSCQPLAKPASSAWNLVCFVTPSK